MSTPRAGRELDALVAEKVMGWAPGERGTPTFSTSIAAAWQLVEKLRPRFYLSLEVHLDHVNACFCPHGEVFRSDGTHMYRGEAATAPHAICLAALAVPTERSSP